MAIFMRNPISPGGSMVQGGEPRGYQVGARSQGYPQTQIWHHLHLYLDKKFLVVLLHDATKLALNHSSIYSVIV
jgi:hypothetical protein